MLTVSDLKEGERYRFSSTVSPSLRLEYRGLPFCVLRIGRLWIKIQIQAANHQRNGRIVFFPPEAVTECFELLEQKNAAFKHLLK